MLKSAEEYSWSSFEVKKYFILYIPCQSSSQHAFRNIFYFLTAGSSCMAGFLLLPGSTMVITE
jgi:hypothetical protein